MIGSYRSPRMLLAGFFEHSSDPLWLEPIEGMRGLAALLVCLVHFDALFGAYVPRGSTSSMIGRFAGAVGNTGVDMFFVISGFLIYGILIIRSPPYWNFLRRRIVRLYPVFLFVFAIYFAMSLVSPVRSKIPADASAAIPYILANLLMLPGMVRITPIIAVAWALSYEVFFYASLPLVVYGFEMKRWTPAMRVLFFAAAVIVYYSACSAGYAHHPRLVMFVAGIMLYETMYNSRIPKQLSLGLDYLAILTACASLALAGLHIMGMGHTTKLLVEVPKGTVALLFISFFGLALCALSHNGVLAKFFSFRWVRWFGSISYSYYLTHGMTLNGLRFLLNARHFRGQLRPIWYLILEGGCFSMTVLIAVGVYLLIERPISLAKHTVAVGLHPKGVADAYCAVPHQTRGSESCARDHRVLSAPYRFNLYGGPLHSRCLFLARYELTSTLLGLDMAIVLYRR
jgi:exopolysaccharide production protein ExoZ